MIALFYYLHQQESILDPFVHFLAFCQVTEMLHLYDWDKHLEDPEI